MTVYEMTIKEKNAFAAEIESKAKSREEYVRLMTEFVRGLWTDDDIRMLLR